MRRRTIIAIHRWLGMFSAVFLVILSLTGLILNHTEFFRLDQMVIRQGWILERYGMLQSRDMKTFNAGESGSLSVLQGSIYFNDSLVSSGAEPIGIFSGSGIVAVGFPESILLLTEEGELIESLAINQFPPDRLEQFATGPDGALVVLAENGAWQPDTNWLRFSEYSGSYTELEMEPSALPEESRDRLLSQHQGEGVTLYRVLLDLHSGRLLGLPGRTVMDLSAVAILLLVSSGLMGWRKRSRRDTQWSLK